MKHLRRFGIGLVVVLMLQGLLLLVRLGSDAGRWLVEQAWGQWVVLGVLILIAFYFFGWLVQYILANLERWDREAKEEEELRERIQPRRRM